MSRLKEAYSTRSCAVKTRHGHCTLEHGARMKHQAITAAVIQEKQDSFNSYDRKYRELHACYLSGMNHCFHRHVIWMLCNWPCNHSSQFELSFQCGSVWVFELACLSNTCLFVLGRELHLSVEEQGLDGCHLKSSASCFTHVAPGKQGWFLAHIA